VGRRGEDAIHTGERDLKLIIDTIPALAWSARPDGSAEFLNQQYLDFIGLSADQAVDRNWMSAVHPEDLAGLAATWHRILASGAPGEAEARLRRHDGEYRWFLLRTNPLRDEKRNIVKWYAVNTDIDDRKRAEADLRRSYDSFVEAQRLSKTGSFTADIVADEHIWSDELYRICEFEPGTKITKNWAREIIHPEDVASFDAGFARSLGGADFDLTFRIVTRSGKVKHLHSIARLVDRVEGRPLFIGAIQDVTDSRITEEALGKREREFRLLVETIPALVWRSTRGGELDYLNQRAIDYLGHTTQSLSSGRWLELVHPDHRDSTVRRWLHSVTTGCHYEDVYKLRRADGEYRWIQSVGEPFRDMEGVIAHWYGLVIDIEDRKQAETELRRAYDSFADAQRLSHTGSFITDLLGDDHNWSEQAFRIFEFEPGSKVSVERIRDMIHPDDLPSFESVIARGLQGENVTFAFRIVTAAGAIKHVRGVAHVVEHDAGHPLFVGALQDVTESVVAEEAERTRIARELHDTLLQTVQGASLYVGAALHEVTPDSPIRPRLERIIELMGQGIEESRNAIQGLRSSNSHTTDLVLALSRIHEELEAGSDIRFSVKVTGQQKRWPPQTQNEIYRIGREAVVNAFCHSRAKHIELELTYSESELSMRIRDNGCGIDPQVLEGGRAGHWGLSGMRERAARINGQLKISSSATAGTEVQLSVPDALAG